MQIFNPLEMEKHVAAVGRRASVADPGGRVAMQFVGGEAGILMSPVKEFVSKPAAVSSKAGINNDSFLYTLNLGFGGPTSCITGPGSERAWSSKPSAHVSTFVSSLTAGYSIAAPATACSVARRGDATCRKLLRCQGTRLCRSKFKQLDSERFKPVPKLLQ